MSLLGDGRVVFRDKSVNLSSSKADRADVEVEAQVEVCDRGDEVKAVNFNLYLYPALSGLQLLLQLQQIF